MAQPTVTSRPATWSGTSGPILYKFTSTNYANAGYYMAVEIWDSTAAAKIADGKYYANSSGVVTVDISSFLKSNMSLDLEADLTSGTVYTDVNWIKYYIKYQEIWTASSETKVDDVANLRYAVYGGLQLGVINDYTDYVPSTSSKKFLLLSDNPKGVRGYPFLIGVIGGKAILLEEYLKGTKVTESIDALNEGEANLIKIDETDYDRVDLTVIGATTDTWVNGRPVSGLNQFDSVTLGVADGTALEFAFFNFPYSGVSLQSETVAVNVTCSDLTGDVILYMTLYDSGGSTITGSTVSLNITYNGIYVLTSTPSSPEVPAYKTIYFDAGASVSHMADITIEVINEPFSETVSVDLIEECQNTIVLAWRNSLGGPECFPFQYNQEYTWYYGDRKAKRLTLFAKNLTLSQWEAIQGLNTLGELYRTPITEMTTSLNRTSATIGQSVYVLNSDGTKTGVNVIGQSNTTNTKQKRHSAIVTIEYPELFLQ